MQKNVAGQSVCSSLVALADGTAVTSGTTTVYVTGDTGSQATGTGSVSHKGQGCWEYLPAQAETNYNAIAFTFVNSLAVGVTVNVPTVADTAAAQTAQTTISTNLNATVASRYAGTPPTTAAIATAVAAAILTNPGNLLTTDATGKIGINNLPIEFLSSTEQTELTNAISDLNSILSSDATFATNFGTVQTALNTLLSRIGQAVLYSASGNVKSDAEQWGGGALPTSFGVTGKVAATLDASTDVSGVLPGSVLENTPTGSAVRDITEISRDISESD